MLRFATPLRLFDIGTYLGMVLRFIAAVLLVPLAVALALREFDYAVSFGVAVVGCGIVGWVVGRFRPSQLHRREAIVVTALAYPIFALIGGLVLLPSVGYVDGVFETMSGITTTGLTVIIVEDAPWTLLAFRAYTQWIGGVGIIVLSIVVLLGTSRSALYLFVTEYGEENVAGSVVATAKVVVRVYVALTLVGIVALFVAGMPAPDAVLHGLTAISTGGFSTHTASIGFFEGSVPVHLVLMALMIAGAVSFPLYYFAFLRGVRHFARDTQLRILLGLCAVSGAVFALTGEGGLTEVTRSVFNAVSALTGTGFASGDPIVWPVPWFSLAIVLMAIGGSTGSTTGGIKQYRLGVAMKSAGRAALEPNLPEHAQLPLRFNGEVVEEKDIVRVLAVVGAYFAVLVLSALALTLGGVSAANAIFEASSAVGTVGLSTGVTGPDTVAWIKGILIVDMWAGRLEMVPLFVLAVNLRLLFRRVS